MGFFYLLISLPPTLGGGGCGSPTSTPPPAPLRWGKKFRRDPMRLRSGLFLYYYDYHNFSTCLPAGRYDKIIVMTVQSNNHMTVNGTKQNSPPKAGNFDAWHIYKPNSVFV